MNDRSYLSCDQCGNHPEYRDGNDPGEWYPRWILGRMIFVCRSCNQQKIRDAKSKGGNHVTDD